jgi:protein involved in polysaccharide export with SLBB domain
LESERAAAQLAALMGKASLQTASDARPTEPPKAPAPEAPAAPPESAALPIAAAAPATTAATTTASENERAAAQLTALQGSVAPPAPSSAAPGSVEAAGLGPAAPRAALTRCDEPPDTVRIAPGDKVSIQVDHLKEVSRTVEVGSDGQIDLPLLGRVPAAGRNQRELVANLEQRLEVYLQAPRVDVALTRRACPR